jgi:hypothetical protein
MTPKQKKENYYLDIFMENCVEIVLIVGVFLMLIMSIIGLLN